MDREKVIKELEECLSASCRGYRPRLTCPYNDDEWDIMRDALVLLKEQRWIPVGEQKPKSMANKVIVYLQHEELVDHIGYGHYEKFQGEEMWYDLESGEQFSRRGYTVTHWMPMPESPKGERLTLC